MAESAQRVPESSSTYSEFARLYDLARQLRPTGADRWDRTLYATSGGGGFDHRTGAIGVNERTLREGLTRDATADPRQQAHALATVLHRATHAGMELDAPLEANAVRTDKSLGLADGVALVRAATDFENFSTAAGYPGLRYDGTRPTGAYVATNDMIEQASGPRVDRHELLDRLSRGPGAMQFDRLAEAVVQNRLAEIAPAEGPDREAMRRELIGTMLHPAWEKLAGQSPEAGQHVAEQIGRALNAKVDELRRKASRPEQDVATGGVERAAGGMERAGGAQGAGGAEYRSSGEETSRSGGGGPTVVGDAPAARFLSGMVSAHRATGRKPSLGDGSRSQASGGGAAAHARGPGGLGS